MEISWNVYSSFSMVLVVHIDGSQYQIKPIPSSLGYHKTQALKMKLNEKKGHKATK